MEVGFFIARKLTLYDQEYEEVRLSPFVSHLRQVSFFRARVSGSMDFVTTQHSRRIDHSLNFTLISDSSTSLSVVHERQFFFISTTDKLRLSNSKLRSGELGQTGSERMISMASN